MNVLAVGGNGFRSLGSGGLFGGGFLDLGHLASLVLLLEQKLLQNLGVHVLSPWRQRVLDLVDIVVKGLLLGCPAGSLLRSRCLLGAALGQLLLAVAMGRTRLGGVFGAAFGGLFLLVCFVLHLLLEHRLDLRLAELVDLLCVLFVFDLLFAALDVHAVRVFGHGLVVAFVR